MEKNHQSASITYRLFNICSWAAVFIFLIVTVLVSNEVLAYYYFWISLLFAVILTGIKNYYDKNYDGLKVLGIAFIMYIFIDIIVRLMAI